MKRMTRLEYKYERAVIRQQAAKELYDLKLKYKRSGFNSDDDLNSIYVRSIYYKVTIKNIKRDGFIKFFVGKFLAERRYLYYRSIRRPANLACTWYWPEVPPNIGKYAFDGNTTKNQYYEVMAALAKAEEELTAKANSGKISATGKDASIERNKEAKKARESFANAKKSEA